MMRPSVIVAAVCMLAALGGLAYLHTTREQAAEEAASATEPPQGIVADEPSPAVAAPSSEAITSTDTPTPAAASSNEPAPARALATADAIAQWIKDAEGNDPKARAAAIAALADAPKVEALQVLKRVLQTGEPNVDRHIALRSLHSLALREGDENEQIRDAMRDVIYHGDDDQVTQTAQSLLDDVEAAIAQNDPNSQKPPIIPDPEISQ